MVATSSFRATYEGMKVIPEMTSENSCLLALALPGFVRMMLLRGCVSITLKATNWFSQSLFLSKKLVDRLHHVPRPPEDTSVSAVLH